jgi:hypothetical protein
VILSKSASHSIPAQNSFPVPRLIPGKSEVAVKIRKTKVRLSFGCSRRPSFSPRSPPRKEIRGYYRAVLNRQAHSGDLALFDVFSRSIHDQSQKLRKTIDTIGGNTMKRSSILAIGAICAESQLWRNLPPSLAQMWESWKLAPPSVCASHFSTASNAQMSQSLAISS